MDLSEYWRVLGEGGITRERLESFERPILNEPLPRPQIKISLIKDFTKYLAILKSVHSGADLIECIRALRRRPRRREPRAQLRSRGAARRRRRHAALSAWPRQGINSATPV